jgi:hypothetical protein
MDYVRTLSSRSWLLVLILAGCGPSSGVPSPEVFEEGRKAMSTFDRRTTSNEGNIEPTVRKYVFELSDTRSPEAEGIKDSLLSQTERVHPVLLTLLEEPLLRESLITALPAPKRGEDPRGPGAAPFPPMFGGSGSQTPGDMSVAFGKGAKRPPEAPIDRLCELFGDQPPQAVVQALKPFLDASGHSDRPDILRAIAATGSVEAVEPLRAALTGENRYLTYSGMVGLTAAAQRGPLAPEITTALFFPLQESIRSATEGPIGGLSEACSLLIQFDRDQALAFLLSEEMLSPNSIQINAVLEALSQARVDVPRSALLRMLESIQELPVLPWRAHTAAKVALMLATHKATEDRALLEALADFSPPPSQMAEVYPDNLDTIREGAAAALLVSHGLDQVWSRVERMSETNSLGDLEEFVGQLGALESFNYHVLNGGLGDYFHRESGAEWSTVIAGFTNLDMPGKAELVRKACAVFGSDGPAPEQQAREQQVLALGEAEYAFVKGLENAYRDSPENLKVQVARYVIKNAVLFREKIPR